MRRQGFLILTLLLVTAGSASGRQRAWGGPQAPFGTALRAALAHHPDWTAVQESDGSPRMYDKTVASGRFLYAGTEHGLARSLDGGRTWTRHPVAPDAPAVTTLAAHGSLVWVGTPGGVYRSQDAGRTWFSANLGMEQTDVTILYRASTGTLFAAAHGSCPLYRSRSDGQLWSCVGPEPVGAPIDAIGEDSAGRLVVTRSETTLRSTDEGHTWQVAGRPSVAGPTIAVVAAGSIPPPE